MYRRTGVLRLHTAYVVALVGVALIVPVITALLAVPILLAAYIVETLAYRDAKRITRSGAL